MSLERILSATETAGFANRQRQMLETVDRQGINAENAVIIGGCAFILYDLNAYASLPGESTPQPFDLDYFRVPRTPEPDSRRERLLSRRGSGLVEVPGTDDTLLVTIVDGKASDRVARYFNYDSYEQMLESRVLLGGLATLPLANLVHAKIQRESQKDLAGLIKAHVIGFETGNSHIEERAWKAAIKHVMFILDPGNRGLYDPYLSSKRPDWLNFLIYSQFEHPAFDGLRLRSN